MKGCVNEYSDCTVDDIVEKYIEGTPEVGSVGVHADDTNRPKKSTDVIKGSNNEDSTLTEGTLFYDVRFDAIAPKSADSTEQEEVIRLIINVEAQTKFKPGYSLTKRAIYYCSRMISAQHGPIFTKSEFQCKRKKGTTPCSYHTVPEKMLMMVAMKQIHHLVSTMCEEEKMVKEMLNNGGLDSTRSIKVKENSIAFRIQETEERRLRLYEDYKAEILDEEEYSQLKEHYIAEKQRLEQELQKQRQRSLELEKRMRICDEQMERMRAILNQKEFDEELVHELIKKIYVGIDNSVEIEFKCSDPYQEVLAFVAEVQNE